MSTTVYDKNQYIPRMRVRISKPTCWKEILDVQINDNRTIVRGALTTETELVAGTRGTAYTYGSYVLAQDTQTISLLKNIPILIDEADRYQQSYLTAMSVADLQGQKVNEFLESAFLAQYGSWTDFGATDLANTGDDDTTKIDISASNIDDLILAVERKIYDNNGVDLAVQNGISFVWRPKDWIFLKMFVMANGFSEADIALKNGIPVQKGFRYMGHTHYLSTQHTATHIFAGINKLGIIGILRGTYGQAKFLEDPGSVSGLGIVTRLDYGFDFCATTTYYKEFWCDINAN